MIKNLKILWNQALLQGNRMHFHNKIPKYTILKYICSLYIFFLYDKKTNARKQARPTAQHGYFSNYPQAPFCFKS